MPYSGKGRPSKIDDVTGKQWDEMIEAIELGVPYHFVAGCVGVTEETFRNWLGRGEEDRDAGVDSVFAEFFGRVEDSKRAFVLKVARAQHMHDKGHKGLEWIASRRHPEHFHQGTKVEHSGHLNGKQSVTVFDASVLDQLAAVDDVDEE